MTVRVLSVGLAALAIGWLWSAGALAQESSKQGQSSAKSRTGFTGHVPFGQRARSHSNDPFDQAEAAAKADPSRVVSPGEKKEKEKPKLERATFGAGCFWHVEAEFEWLPGVKSAVSGYSGGRVRNPSYEMVHEGSTGHIEVVQVVYDPSVITYEQLLQVFWHGHDPTQWNRQGPDVGTQYRSAIFYHSEAQRKAALASYRHLVSKRAYRAPIVTLLLPMRAFYRAEEYHQNYYGGKPDQPRVRHMSRAKRAAHAAARRKAAAAAAKAREQSDAKPASDAADEQTQTPTATASASSGSGSK